MNIVLKFVNTRNSVFSNNIQHSAVLCRHNVSLRLCPSELLPWIFPEQSRTKFHKFLEYLSKSFGNICLSVSLVELKNGRMDGRTSHAAANTFRKRNAFLLST